MADVRDVVSGQLEVVDRQLQKYFEATSNIAKLIASVPAVKISRYLGRVPFMRHRGGVFAKMSANEGLYPTGTGMVLSHLTFGVIYSDRAYRVTDEAKDTTASSDQAVVNVATEQIAGAMEDLTVDDENTMFGNGDGTYTNSCSSPVAGGAGTTGATFIFAGATDYLRLNKLRIGMAVEVWSQDFSTKRAVAAAVPTTITSIDYSTFTVVLSQNVTLACPAGSQDVFAVPGLDSYGPATLVTGSSTWPLTGVAGGLGGDSWRHGIYYAHEVSTSASYLGRSRSTFPELKSNRVNAGAAAITWGHGRQLQDMIIARTNLEQITGQIGLAHSATVKTIEDIIINITSVQLTRGDTTGPSMPTDLAAFNKNYGQPVMYCQTPVYRAKKQVRNRIDFLHLASWKRAQFFEPQFLDGGDAGKYLWRGRSGAQLAAYYEFHLRQAYDLVCVNPMLSGYIDNLLTSASYPN